MLDKFFLYFFFWSASVNPRFFLFAQRALVSVAFQFRFLYIFDIELFKLEYFVILTLGAPRWIELRILYKEI